MVFKDIAICASKSGLGSFTRLEDGFSTREHYSSSVLLKEKRILRKKQHVITISKAASTSKPNSAFYSF